MSETIFMLLAFVAFSVAFEHARVGAIVGLLIAGALVGPHGLGLVREVETVDFLAELGIMFLLFTVGLEIKLDRLRLYGARTYVLAIAQLVATTLAGAVAAARFGLDIDAAIVIGGAIAFSSTALVLQVLADLGRTITHLGRLAIAILLIQDIGVGPALIVLESMAPFGDAQPRVAMTLLLTFAVLAAIAIAGRYLLPPLLRFVSERHGEELFLAVVLAAVLSAGFALEEVGASAAIGAFIVGLLVADTPYRHQVAADIAPFRGLLVGVFFMAVGMHTDLRLMAGQVEWVVLIALAIILGKAVVLFVLARMLGNPARLSAELGLLLSQGSEFSFILLAAAVVARIVPAEVASLLVAAVAVSMAAVPALANAARGLIDRIEGQAVASPAALEREAHEFRDHVVVVGFGQVGMALTRHLRSLGQKVLVIDYSTRRVRSTQAHGLPVYYGNATRTEVLRSCHVEDACLVVVALSDDDVAARTLELVRRLAPGVPVLVRSSTSERAAELIRAGAAGVVPDSLTTALDLAERAVLLIGAPHKDGRA